MSNRRNRTHASDDDNDDDNDDDKDKDAQQGKTTRARNSNNCIIRSYALHTRFAAICVDAYFIGTDF